MSLWRQASRGLRNLAARGSANREIDDEYDSYVDEAVAANVARGMSAAEARRAALSDAGTRLQTREQVRDYGWESRLAILLSDVRFTIRRLASRPGFTIACVLTLALGIGASTAIFSVIEGVLIKPLPYRHPEQLIELRHTAPGINIRELGMGPSLYYTYSDENRVFQGIGIWTHNSITLTGLGNPEQLRSLIVNRAFLSVLGVQPTLGRDFNDTDDRPDGPPTVILADGYWRTRFGADPHAIGRHITLAGNDSEIIGVLPRRFEFMDQKFSIVRPIQSDRSETLLVQFCCQGIARLKPGATVAQANADVSRMLPLDPLKFPMNPALSPTLWKDARIAPMLRPLKDALVGNLADTLWVLMGTVGIVLLIACANVANLMLVRADTRRQELAIRASLGADQFRIARELVLESALLGGTGGVLGLVCAFCSMRLFSTSEFEHLPRIHEITVDGPVLIFCLAASLMAGVVFGLIPVFRYIRPTLMGALRGGTRSQTQSRESHRARNVLVVVQMALALVLLVGSGLMIRSFQQLRRVAPGFSAPGEVETFRVVIPSAQVKEFRGVINMQEAMMQKVQAIPGVRSAALINELPMDGGNNDPVFTEDKPTPKTSPIRRFKFISPGYFSTVRSAIVAGRDITWSELDRAAPVALISENLAREWWGSAQGAIGKRIRPYLQGDWREVIGVVPDLHDDGIERPAPTVVYWPLFRRNFYKTPDYDAARNVAFMVRTNRAGSASLVQDLQRAVASVNGSVAVANVGSLESMYDKSLARTSFTVILLAIAGGMALLLGLIGIYGVISWSVSQRTREMGIRLALGSPTGKLRWLFVRHAVLLCAAGASIGLASAFALTRLTKTLLYNISPADPPTYAVVVAGLMVAAMTASYIPARRASRVDPAEALRAE